MNPVTQLSADAFWQKASTCLEELLEGEIKRMGQMDAGKRKIASEGLSAAYVDVALSRQAFVVGTEAGNEKGLKLRQDAVHKFEEMRTELEKPEGDPITPANT
jgi:hypothetical protein